ncbi:YdeI/OmpD-associated family protein [Streptomyces europaeiscabiei]|uniref:YdeI/OmpD-associated family protein n=1 Tax=Streptomyces europaeiscabiei TaxID=146819 RepID=UPI0029B33D14|nr:YdeI/OmpD-associated family protein [Streptomyces europaeiscabiei]MDX3619080.1 YdeI/OmpD-associated family protein [Streptomyces europaeiscabiei]WUD35664.1 YdeI/OmpD-associated family protein [Streptomyces europaeiscabiei]
MTTPEGITPDGTAPEGTTPDGTAPEGTTPDGTEAHAFPDAGHLDAWLTAHPAPCGGGLWVKVAKKGSGIRSVSAGDVNDVALCHGWITGHRRRLDEAYFLQRITPRRPGGDWSMVNVRRVGELTAAGRMRAGGLAEVAAARADGRWEAAYESQKNAVVPEDLAAALERNPRAKAAFDGLGRTDRYLAMLGVLRARTPQSLAAQVAAAVARLEEGRVAR